MLITSVLTARAGRRGAVMLIDWITLRLKRDDAPHWAGWRRLETWGDRIARFCPSTGEVRWTTDAWDSIRSDSHQVAMRCTGSTLWIQGSPARCMGLGDAVFGSDGATSLFLCARAMVAFVGRMIHVDPMPEIRLFRLNRVDVTINYMMSNLASVRVALGELRGVEGGRYRVSQVAGDTVYWSHLSSLRAGKAYAKGPHLRYLAKQGKGKNYDEDDLVLSDKLLRMELRLGRLFWRRMTIPWWSVPWSLLRAEHEQFFGRMLGDDGVECRDMGFVDRICEVAPTVGQGRAAARTWALIQSIGWQATKDSMPERSFYRHLSILKAAGLGDADLSAGRVVSLRRKLVPVVVHSWDELRKAA